MAESGQMEKFDAKRDEWDSWSRRFDQWLSISSYATGDNAADKKRAVFCTLIGSDTFKLLCTLCTPKRPEEESYDDLRTKLNKQFGVKKLVLAERYRFYSYRQQDKQSLAAYLSELRRLASTCQWAEAALGENLRDKFVMGLRNERLLQQLLTQDHTKSLDDLFQLATTFEAAESEALKRSESDSQTTVSPVNSGKNLKSRSRTEPPKKRTQLPSTSQQFSKEQTRTCASCGGNHARKSCRFYSAKCHKCGKIGHIAKVCGSAAVIVSPQESDESAVVPISQSDKQPHADIPPMFQILHLTEVQKRLRLMLDSASPLTFVNVKTWQDLEKPKLTKTDRILGAFEGQPIKPLGYFTTTVVREDDASQSAN